MLQQVVGHVGHSALCLHGLLAVGHAQAQHHLVLPQGNGVHQRGLDLFSHHGVVVLDQPDLGAHLDGDGAGQLQIVQLLLKPVAQVRKVPGRLGVLGQAAGLGLFGQLHQLGLPHLLQLFLAGQDVHTQLLEVRHVHLIHPIQHGHVLQQLHLMSLQRALNLLHVHFDLVVLGLHGFQLVALLFEEAEQALLLFGRVKALQLAHQLGEHIAHFAHVLGAHLAQGGIAEVADLLLAGCAVLQHLLGVADVDLLGEVVHHLLLLRSERGLLHRVGRFGLLFLGKGIQGQAGCGGGILQGQAGGQVLVIHGFHSFLLGGRFLPRSLPAGSRLIQTILTMDSVHRTSRRKYGPTACPFRVSASPIKLCFMRPQRLTGPGPSSGSSAHPGRPQCPAPRRCTGRPTGFQMPRQWRRRSFPPRRARHRRFPP